ncbi:RNA polymerase subunit sigma-24 [candidate division WWE3 bacterium CG09_land_8_20_14_0_10_47_33]|uniref:RNA polymerase subunit sigma-24 n=1 Tax=candidate division WWE3 bacterium CG_4_9_14_0_2_um_filter_48_10 TaxID=1975078 RepID=A0A2M8EJ54_UNCKA|nr:MAG: RNA polymerase subunit sigma-24 [candidate division WWE3 bacterium CG09_land_8_20_14_0_10_47_33]PIZ40974.1 MAG: RNA polymerase subunit sigma-24 [candidate division WWE3 bacterium CG_4_10_14_0_2_um_filter_47_8]PJC22774.1 MAG: RNA polymerase subunit sigma-24 [candidate division WWE3 bacterium CG_4_9_14_0_2_um_filter_48_10]PJE51396.1 MAG: RNA polymerase subunit sigma-24 [candidate division WWE3 bacterium CG10_big_fil_rev_8_21_14_0_10_48_23]
MDLKEEEKLIRQAKAVKSGENKPFAKLYQFYYPKVKNYFLSRTGDETKTEDLTSKVFEKALVGLDSFQWQGIPFSAWLFRIAQNTLFDTFRSRYTTQNIALDKLPPIKTEGAGPEEAAIQNENHEILERLLFKLPQRERDIIYMKFYEGYTNRAIATHLGLSETNVGTILYRTLRRLRQDLQNL